MTKVCHMTSAHDPEDVRIFHKECVSLSKAGYEVYLVQRGESYEKNGVHLIGVGFPSGGRLSRMTTFAKRVYRAALAVDADVYHFHDPELLPYGLKLKKQGKKVIFDSHERYTEQLKSKPYLPCWCTALIARVYGIYEKHTLGKLDAVIFPCTFLGQVLYQDICPRSVLIDNVPRLEEMYDCYVPTDYSVANPLCYVGTLSPERCVSVIIRAAQKIGASLILAGEFNSREYEQENKTLLEADPKTRWIGSINRQQVADLLRRASVGLCPEQNVRQYNTVDNLATKSYEYMAMGLPVIVADYPYSRKVMETYRYGICVNSENVDEIADAIRYLMDHPDEARQMGENGRRAVKEKFNWDIEEQKLFALYEDIFKD